ncbi:thylakoid lumenal 17.9 kDa protein chloroplastic [Tripterygium wilfordii]|uniref:Thylakoid lumenal 17.9 kDa protein chloroplastic n=1 Tax=Tripterygium wilfordii TaxID=458696 RepID=A0A7J7CAR9_TRIWF|nr:thylakoid lumenal 17.9 kDa protein, chloroplastic [Tripterygium wilfordii]KAF5730957.1 thylakoid lumenal 17.9 kDa protein chloroplastic [Tripterygium wilfordii]
MHDVKQRESEREAENGITNQWITSTKMSLIGRLLPPLPSSISRKSNLEVSPQPQTAIASLQNPNRRPILSKLLSIALTVALGAPLPSFAIPSLNSQSPPPLSSTTPFSQSKSLKLGLENGKIRPCPSTNPGCISTNPRSSSFAFPWRIPENSPEDAIQKLQQAILETQKNAKIQAVEDTPNGTYLQAEVDGGFNGRDVLEFLVNGDVVAYRSMATKVTYIYPFTTALGDSKGQEERMMKIMEQLGWYAPNFDSMD